jgi:hypothetical protein
MSVINLPIASPGVIIREFDLSVSQPPTGATTVYLAGFTPQGPTDEPIFISSMSQFEDLFGTPQTDAEKYSFNAAKQILTTSPATLLFTRMPYGSGCGYGYGSDYAALVYPLVSVQATEVDVCDFYLNLSDDEIAADFPWLQSYISKDCVGSKNFDCPIPVSAVPTLNGYIVNQPVTKNGQVLEFRVRVVDPNDLDGKTLKISHLRKSLSGTSDYYQVGDDLEFTDLDQYLEGNTLVVPVDAIPVKIGDLFAYTATGEFLAFYESTSENISKLIDDDLKLEECEKVLSVAVNELSSGSLTAESVGGWQGIINFTNFTIPISELNETSNTELIVTQVSPAEYNVSYPSNILLEIKNLVIGGNEIDQYPISDIYDSFVALSADGETFIGWVGGDTTVVPTTATNEWLLTVGASAEFVGVGATPWQVSVWQSNVGNSVEVSLAGVSLDDLESAINGDPVLSSILTAAASNNSLPIVPVRPHALTTPFELACPSEHIFTDNTEIVAQYCLRSNGLSCDEIHRLKLKVPESKKNTYNPVMGECQLRDGNFYVLGDPILVELNDSEYELLQNGQFNWKCGCFSNVEAKLDLLGNDVRAGLIVVNERKSSTQNDFSGYYVTVTDNLNVNPNTDFNSVTGVKAAFDKNCFNIVDSGWQDLAPERQNFTVSEAFNSNLNSIASIVEQSAGLDYGLPLYNDSLTISVFRLRPTSFNQNTHKLSSFLVEKYIGSLNAERRITNPDGGRSRSFYLEDVVNNNSPSIKVFVNPFLSKNNCWEGESGSPQKTVRIFKGATADVFDEGFTNGQKLKAYADNLYSINAQNSGCVDNRYEVCRTKDIGNLPCKLERAVRTVENPDTFDIDVVLDGGLSTIWATRNAVADDACLGDPGVCYNYDANVFIDTNALSPVEGGPLSSPLYEGWLTVTNILHNFSSRTMSALGVGALFVSDPLRQIFVNGENFKVVQRQTKTLLDPKTGLPQEKYATFSRNIWTYLRNLYIALDSSWMTSVATWIKDFDAYGDKAVWFPFSPYYAAMLGRIDAASYPWIPPFGANGSITGGLELAINPNQKERDLLYKIQMNSVVESAQTGRRVWTGETLQRNPSALSKVNVRRLLIALQKPTRRLLHQFIGEPNDIITRTRVINALTPIFEEAKQNRGLYDYMLVCDDNNNRPEDVDNGILRVAIYLKPIKGVEFILADFFITNTSVEFGELM